MVRRSQRLASKSKASESPPADEKPLPPLPSVSEQDDSPVDKPAETVTSNAQEPKTPGRTSPIKPPMSEMHPSKVHPTVGAPSSAQRLGFTDIKPISGRNDLPSAIQATPSRITVPSSDFTFRSAHRPPTVDVGLSEEAQKMMAEIREKAEGLKETVRPEVEQETLETLSMRKIAQAKKKGGRYSAAHQAEFDKMDSIANHPSAFRLQQNRTTPQTAGVKRSQSKANLDESDAPRSKTPASVAQSKRSAATEEHATGAKRARQNIEDDVSSKRPGSRDGSSIPVPKSAPRTTGQIPRPKSTFASLMTPTKSSLARKAGAKTPSQSTLSRSPSKATLSGIPRATATPNPPSTSTKEPAARKMLSPQSRFAKLKEKFLSTKADASKAKSALPLPSAPASKTPAPVRSQTETLPVPMTTPGRKLIKRVTFTPDTKRAAMDQKSPSPVKSCIPQIKKRVPGGEVHYPSLDGMIAESTEPTVSYPDLSSQSQQRPLPDPPIPSFKGGSAEPSVPGEFTFRSDHTISFGSPAKSFGSSPGQASVRVVRPSIHPIETATTTSSTASTISMPGSYPASATSSGADADDEADADKENEAPAAPTTHKKSRTTFLALPHGMSTKKRNRVSTDEEEAEREAAERASKKLRRELVPEGEALLAPRLVAAAKAAANGAAAGAGSVPVKKPVANGNGGAGGINASPRRLAMPGHMPGTPSPMKKRGISWKDIKNVIQDLFQVLVQVSNYDAFGRSTRDALAQDFQTLSQTLAHLHATTAPSPSPSSEKTVVSPAANKPIPEPLIHYVENGRNPDIYTREFVELVRRMNQLARGKAHAFASFRDVLAREMAAALPEVREDVARVLEATGGGPGSLEGLNDNAAAAQGTGSASSGAGGDGQGQRP
ncbi:hypothetical protein VTJ49DRAFT_1213 [Mycothermus thermophilus]|uniref:Mediator complex subunit 10 n=1 Tax=Humicola insolens TaxID=85995 RepID=A0ABR3VE01_HUMIN